MKKSVSAIMAALMAASVVLAGCGSGNTGATAAETAAGTTAGAVSYTHLKHCLCGTARGTRAVDQAYLPQFPTFPVSDIQSLCRNPHAG